LLAAAVALAAPTLVASRSPPGAHVVAAPANPFEFVAVLKMAALLATIALLARWAAESLGGEAVLAVAAVTGLADVDAVTLSVLQLVPTPVTPQLAGAAIGIAVASNIVAKCGYAFALGGARFGLRLAPASIAALAAGGAALLAAS
jgi:uncharacterized membrane protein (DUF4010 family)